MLFNLDGASCINATCLAAIEKISCVYNSFLIINNYVLS